MPIFRAILLLNLRTGVRVADLEAFLIGEYCDVFRELGAPLTSIEVVRHHIETGDVCFAQASPDYVVVESWQGREARATFGQFHNSGDTSVNPARARLLRAIRRLDEELAERVGTFHGASTALVANRESAANVRIRRAAGRSDRVGRPFAWEVAT